MKTCTNEDSEINDTVSVNINAMNKIVVFDVWREYVERVQIKPCTILKLEIKAILFRYTHAI